MSTAYSLTVNQWQNIFPNAWFQQTDPSLDAGNQVRAGIPWFVTEADSGWATITALKIRNAANDGWITLIGTGAGITDADTLDGLDSTDFRLKSAPVIVKTANYTVAEGDETILVDATGGAVTISLPAAATLDGVTFFISKVDSGANTVTIEPDGAEEINGASNRILNSAFEGTLIQADGANDRWLTLARPGAGAAPEGSAGGALTGSYPNPTIASDVALPGSPTTTTQAASDDSTKVATTGFVQAVIAALRDGVSASFDTLAELATALGLKAPLASPTFTGTVTLPADQALTGNPTAPTQTSGNSSTRIASTAFVADAVAKQGEVLIIAVSDESTAITTGTAKVTFRMPFAMTLTAVRASLTASSSSGNPTIDVKESGTTIFSTTLTIDSGEKTSTTAATAAVLSDTSLADDAEMTIDITTAGTGAKGLKVYLIGTRT